jgi:transposase
LSLHRGESAYGIWLPASIPNTSAVFKILHKSISKCITPVHIVCEATGPYHGPLVRFLHQAGFKVSVVNPRLSRDFERAEGKLGKTDAIDAQQLADYGRTMQPTPTTPPE